MYAVRVTGIVNLVLIALDKPSAALARQFDSVATVLDASALAAVPVGSDVFGSAPFFAVNGVIVR